MKRLIKKDLTKDGEPKYNTFFYHKQVDKVFHIVTNGNKSSISVADDLNIPREMRFSSEIPKYILNKLIVEI
jgi:hypothetical protein